MQVTVNGNQVVDALRIVRNPQHLKEFWQNFNGTCGETALAVAIASALLAAKTHDETVQLMLSITHEMQAQGWASANGASTLWSLAREAVRRHASIAHESDYQEPLQFDWHGYIAANAGIVPIVLQFANAQALPGDEAGVHYHFATIVGICAEGYIVADGDNWAAEQSFQLYTYANLQAAVICGLLSLNVQTVTGAQPVAVPAGWTDANGVITAPNKNQVKQGFADYIRSHPWEADDQPLGAEQYVNSVLVEDGRWGAGSVQYFVRSGLFWAKQPDPSLGKPGTTDRIPMGRELQFTQGMLDTANKAVAATAAQYDAANAKATALQAQVDDAHTALAAMDANLKAAQAALDAADVQITQLTDEEASTKQALSDADSKITTLDALVAQLQQQLDDLKANGTESPEAKQVIQSMLSLDAAIIALKKATGL